MDLLSPCTKLLCHCSEAGVLELHPCFTRVLGCGSSLWSSKLASPRMEPPLYKRTRVREIKASVSSGFHA